MHLHRVDLMAVVFSTSPQTSLCSNFVVINRCQCERPPKDQKEKVENFSFKQETLIKIICGLKSTVQENKKNSVII